MEEKVYSRSVNKSGLAARVIDQKNPERNFSKAELQDIMDIDNWVQCDACDKWRMLAPYADLGELPDKWYCEMNVYDKDRSFCSAKERDEKFYLKFFAEQRAQANQNCQEVDSIRIPPSKETVTFPTLEKSDMNALKDSEKDQKTQRDVILSKLLLESKSFISKYYFHDSMLKSTDVAVN